jgi:hypothetical protein
MGRLFDEMVSDVVGAEGAVVPGYLMISGVHYLNKSRAANGAPSRLGNNQARPDRLLSPPPVWPNLLN